MFLPAYTGQISDSTPKITFEGNCFKEVSFDFKFDQGSSIAQIEVETKGKRNLTCSDFFLFANIEVYHVEDFMREGKHTIKLKVPNEDAAVDMFAHGLGTYLFCESLRDETLSVLQTVKAFVGGLGLHGKVPLFEPKVPEYMEKANIDFMKWSLKLDFEERKTRKVEIDESLI
jgi:hypothetical protein